MIASKLSDILQTTMTTYSSSQIIINMLVTLILSSLVYWTYKKTYSGGVLYSRSFNITIMLITLVTSMVIMIISGNLVLSLGMVGALSIIRFRSAIKDPPKDIGFLFWGGIAVGLATGTGSHQIAIMGSLIIALIMVLVHLKRFDDSAYLLIIKGKDMDYSEIGQHIKDQSSKHRLRMRNTLGNEQEIIYEVKFKGDGSSLIDVLEAIEAIHTVHLVTYNGEVNN